MLSSTIRELAFADLDIPLHEPFGISGGALAMVENLLVTIELADGTRGYGEAAPFPAFNGETRPAARAALTAARDIVLGADAREWRRISHALDPAVAGAASARCAVETALLDALTRRKQMPLWVFFGGASGQLETDMTITTGSVEQAAAAAADILQRGISSIKIKVGGDDLPRDIERVLAVHSAAPAAQLLLDGNAGYTADQTLELLAVLHNHGLRPALMEQPVPRDDWAGMRQVAQWGGVPVAADESLGDSSDMLRLLCERAAQVANIKLMKCGIVEALAIAAIARSAGLSLMIGGMVESILAMTTSACFAAGQGGFRFVDLDTPMFLAENPFEGGFRQQGGRLSLDHIQAGHGVSPRPV
jgi:L-Ala-D/L-Glu epimerase